MASPSKRAKLSFHSRLVAAANAVIADEPALLAIIASFIPVATASQSGASVKQSKASHALHVIVSLCRGVPGLGQLIGPPNESFWRSMVLSHYDFTVDASKTFNHQIYDNDTVCYSLDIMKYETLDETELVERKLKDDSDVIGNRAKYLWDRHPARVAIDAWNAERVDVSDQERGDANPKYMLGNDLSFWPSVGAYFQPAKYQFLSDIQSGKASASAWPSNEDAFTLYCDLVLVQNELGSFGEDEMETWDGFGLVVYPCLLGRLEGEIKTLKVKESGSNESTGDEDDEDDEDDDDDDDYDQTDYMFPNVYSESTFMGLSRIVYDSFSDWRYMRISDGKGRASPEFFIGPTKKSGRWIGFIGPFKKQGC